MSGGCTGTDPDALLLSVIRLADCRGAALGEGGWHGLAGSGLFGTLLTALLTVAVAWRGYRLMLGGVPAPGEAVAALVRIGAVVALATSWPAYDHLVYRVATEGPAELADTIFPAGGIEAGALPQRLQNAYDAIREPPAPADGAKPAAAGAELPGTAPTTAAAATRRTAATVFGVAGIGALVATRLAIALLLALGPIAALALLFDATLGLFAGWLRATLGAALAALAIPLALSVELEALEGPVRAAAKAGTTEIPGLDVIVWSFALVVLALIVAAQRMAGGIQLVPGWRSASAGIPALWRQAASPPPGAVSRPVAATPAAPAAPSRALGVAQAAVARSRHTATSIAGRAAASGPQQLRVVTPPAPPRSTLLLDGARPGAGRRTIGGKHMDVRA